MAFKIGQFVMLKGTKSTGINWSAFVSEINGLEEIEADINKGSIGEIVDIDDESFVVAFPYATEGWNFLAEDLKLSSRTPKLDLLEKQLME